MSCLFAGSSAANPSPTARGIGYGRRSRTACSLPRPNSDITIRDGRCILTFASLLSGLPSGISVEKLEALAIGLAALISPTKCLANVELHPACRVTAHDVLCHPATRSGEEAMTFADWAASQQRREEFALWSVFDGLDLWQLGLLGFIGCPAQKERYPAAVGPALGWDKRRC